MGSAQAVRDAVAAGAAAPNGDDARLALERELDRLNVELAAQASALSQHLNWTLLIQAFLLGAWLIVLVGGWSVPLPGKRWLLAAIAGYAVLGLLLGTLAMRGTRSRLRPLREARRQTEEALQRVAARPPVFSRGRAQLSAIAVWASRAMSLAIVAGWGALSLYALATPMPTDVRAAADARGETKSAGAPRPAAPVRSAQPRKIEEAPAAVAPPPEPEPAADGDNRIATWFRRALAAPPAERAEEPRP